jgi:hypothetical protein
MKKLRRQLVLNKGKEKFIFRYDSGCEDKLLDTLIEQVEDKRTSFDWFDAAVISFKLTQSLLGQANTLLQKGPTFYGQMQRQQSQTDKLNKPDTETEIKII